MKLLDSVKTVAQTGCDSVEELTAFSECLADSYDEIAALYEGIDYTDIDALCAVVPDSFKIGNDCTISACGEDACDADDVDAQVEALNLALGCDLAVGDFCGGGSVGVIIGAIVGVVAVIAVIAIVCFVMRK